MYSIGVAHCIVYMCHNRLNGSGFDANTISLGIQDDIDTLLYALTQAHTCIHTYVHKDTYTHISQASTLV